MFCHPAEVDSNLGGVAICSDTMDDRTHLHYGPRQGLISLGLAVSFAVWAVD